MRSRKSAFRRGVLLVSAGQCTRTTVNTAGGNTMKLAWAFFARDAVTAMSYRASFVVQLLGNLLVLGVFYYIGATIGDQHIPSLKEYGGSYLAFLLIGIALTDCVGVSL